jgi:hypothetical protein
MANKPRNSSKKDSSEKKSIKNYPYEVKLQYSADGLIRSSNEVRSRKGTITFQGLSPEVFYPLFDEFITKCQKSAADARKEYRLELEKDPEGPSQSSTEPEPSRKESGPEASYSVSSPATRVRVAPPGPSRDGQPQGRINSTLGSSRNY